MNWKILMLLSSMTLTANIALASKDRGGGDACENRIKTISSDLNSWIQEDGPAGLKLPKGLAVRDYSKAMLSETAKAKVNCVGKGDKEFPVEILGTPKICRFDKAGSNSKITCDFEKFRSLTDEEQYVLVHHEYAGLAGIEPAIGDDSRYDISNQISAYLVETTIKKLAVKPPVDQKAICESGIQEFVKAKFPFDDATGVKQPIVEVRVDLVQFVDATGEVDIEAHALFDEDGFTATRIFIAADAVWNNHPNSESTPASCQNYRVKASFSDPLAE